MSTKTQPINLMDVSVAEFYSEFDQWLQRYSHMNLARWKILQNSGISLLVAYLALQAGADPTVAIAVIALVNGLSFGELASVWGVSVEMRGDGPPVQVDRSTEQNDDQAETNKR